MKIKSIFVVMLMSLLVLGGCSNSSSDNGKKSDKADNGKKQELQISAAASLTDVSKELKKNLKKNIKRLKLTLTMEVQVL